MAFSIEAAGTGAELSTVTWPLTADAETCSTLGSLPTNLAMRTSHERQVMPFTGMVTEIVPASVTTLFGASMPAGRGPRPIRYSRSSMARRCDSSWLPSVDCPGSASAGVGTTRSCSRACRRSRAAR